MARVSQAQAQENRERVVGTAARMIRERGVAGVSVADLMAAAGLTHGGFYKQFASKEALVEEATGQAYAATAAGLHETDARHPGDHAAARREWIGHYLSPEHRDSPGDGCPVAALAPDVARDAAAREPFGDSVAAYAGWLSGESDDGLADLATMVGALLLARATAGSPLSDRVLRAARDALAPEPGPHGT